MNIFGIVLGVNLLFLLFRIAYIIYYPVDLSPEEAQYWDWSRHLDLSYYSKPPMVAYLNFLSTHLLGNTELGVRITPVVMGFVLSLGVFFFMKELFGDKVALVASTLPHILVGTSINFLLMTTDAPLVFFWGLTVMSIYFAVETNRISLWLVVGILAGLSFLSKYPAVFLLPLTLLYMFLVRKELLIDTKPYISLIPAFVLSLPVLVWNYQMDFVSFKHVSGLASKQASFPNFSSFLEYVGGQLLLLSLFPFFFMAYGWYRSIQEKDKRLLLLTVYSLPVFLFFALLSLRKTVYANWAGFGYFTGILLASVFFYRAWRRLPFLTASVAGFCLFLFVLLHFTPIFDFIKLRNLLPSNKDPVKIMVGWEKLGREVSKFYRENQFIFSDRYQISAELAFYTEGNPRTFVYHTGRMTQYYFWNRGLNRYKGKDAIFVTQWGINEQIAQDFASYELLGEVDITWRGKIVKRFYIYRMKQFSGKFSEQPTGF